jgi:methylmalonyl-CoA epimerase
MKAILDHVGIAISDLGASLAFFRDALGLEVEGAEEVGSQRVRAHFLAAGDPRLELLEPTSPDSTIAKYVGKRGPGLHHVTFRVADLAAALGELKTRGVRLIDERPRPGAEGAMVAFIHPSAAHGVLVELKQLAPANARHSASHISRHVVGDLELIAVSDGFIRFDGGAMFGVVPKPLWQRRTPPDDRNRITLAMRPLIVRGARTMIIDAGLGDKETGKFCDIYGVDRAVTLDQTLAEAGLSPDDIDIVVASHLHFDHAGGFTKIDATGRVVPRFPRAQYVVRRGEWEDATHAHERNRASYLTRNYVPLAGAGVLQLVDDDQTIMPGVRVRRTGGHTMHHQLIQVESGGKAAAFVADLIPTTAHVPDAWIMGYDLYPMDTLRAKQAFIKEAIDKDILVFFEHDPNVTAGYIRAVDDKPSVEPVG